MNAPQVWIDGQRVNEAQAVVPVFDRAFLYGDAVFETIPVYQGKAFRAAAHLQRLAQGAHSLRFDAALDATALQRTLTEATSDGHDAILRVALTRGRSGPAGLATRGAGPATAIVMKLPPRPYASELYAQGANVVVSTVRHYSPASVPTTAKHANYLPSILAYDEAQRLGAHEALLLGDAVQVVEGAFSNVFVVIDGRLRTPALADGALPGITRAAVLELAQRAQIPFEENRISLADLERASEIFLSSSIAGVLPVRSLRDLTAGGAERTLSAPGPLTAQLAHGYWELVRREAGARWSSNRSDQDAERE